MKVEIQSIHFDADSKLLSFIENKVNKLEQFFDGLIDAEVILKVDKASNNENKIVEIKLPVPGTVLFASKQCKTFEEATDLAVEALRRQVKKTKEKIKGL
jgi:putative sigma-54 modulation protein